MTIRYPCEIGVRDPVIEAAALQSIVNFAGSIRRQDHHWRLGSLDGAELRNRYLEIGEQLQQESFELIVCAVDLVDEQNGNASRTSAPVRGATAA